MATKNELEVVCPESTIESANRRNFIRKAALAATAAGVGGALLGRRTAIPASSASSAVCTCRVNAYSCCFVAVSGRSVKDYGVYGNSCDLPGVFGIGPTGVQGCGSVGVQGCGGSYGVKGKAACGVFGCGSTSGVHGHSSNKGVSGCTSCGYGVYGLAAAAGCGVYGRSDAGKGVAGYSCSHIGVLGCSGSSYGAYGRTAGSTCAAGVAGRAGKCGIGVCGQAGCGGTGVYGHAPDVGVKGEGFTGVWGCSSDTGVYAVGGSIGVHAITTTSCGIAIVACAPSCTGANLQQWEIGCVPKSVVNRKGWLGIGTCTPSTPLDVVGSSPSVGTIKSKASSGDKSSLVQFANGDSTAIDWNVGVAGLCNSIKVPDGYFYVQHTTSSTPGISINKCNHVGIGLANPCRVLCVNGRIHTSCGMGLGTQTINTTLAINGSLSIKSRLVKSATTLALSDYAVLANASSAAFTITLPAVSSTAGACNGMILFIKKTDSSANAVTVAASGTDTIEGSGSVALKKQYDSLMLLSNNSSGGHEWFILAGAKCGAIFT
jgi:hypothetical protein